MINRKLLNNIKTEKNCKRCGLKWFSKIDPKACPNCKNVNWNREFKKYICTCIKCGNKWTSRVEEPKACPRCCRYDWKEFEPSSIDLSDKVSIKELKKLKLVPDKVRITKILKHWCICYRRSFKRKYYLRDGEIFMIADLDELPLNEVLANVEKAVNIDFWKERGITISAFVRNYDSVKSHSNVIVPDKDGLTWDTLKDKETK